MGRPKKWRKVRCVLEHDCFGPMDIKQIDNLTDEEVASSVIMTVEEYETIRLIDYCNMTQAESAIYLEIARTSVQKLYDQARKKIAVSLIKGKILRIEGGDYKLCKSDCAGEHCNRNCDLIRGENI